MPSKNTKKKNVAPRPKQKVTSKPARPAAVKKVVAAPKPKTEEKETQKNMPYATLRGMKDLFGREAYTFQRAYHTAENIAASYGFSYIETPIVEQASLFIRSIGKGTDVVDKEMYTFDDKDGSKVSLRPEGTASVARAYVNHGMHTIPQPVKAWYWGPMFRHDRPQAGRFRMFHQFGCETMGEHSPVIDAELISVSYNFLKDLGIDVQVRVNSIGTKEDRDNYLVELVGYLRSKRSYLSEESKKRLLKNPLRVLDSKDEHDRAVIEEAPQIVDWLSEPSKKFFMSVLEYLDEAEIPYVLTPTLVRGLDYYTDTVFEFVEEGVEESQQGALGGGGRFNGLIEYLGGPATPAAGFSIGVERVIASIKRKEDEARKEGKVLEEMKQPTVFFAQLGEQARKRSLLLIERLRRSGVQVAHNLAKSSIKAQLEIANKIGATHTLILGQKEVQDGTIITRNMESGIQEIVDQKKIEAVVRKLLST
ncbi:MAG TPA: histidine--tRNA ligase [Candidatus Magasanikbacteria bacterium]|nr:histidine--tRNA ligase [Candidatus Magasanikbacteria bacterium]